MKWFPLGRNNEPKAPAPGTLSPMRSTMRTIQGPRTQPYQREEFEKLEDRNRLRRRISDRDDAVSSPHNEPARDMHDHTLARFRSSVGTHWDTDKNPTNRSSEYRRPVGNYDIENAPRTPRAISHQLPRKRPQSSPRRNRSADSLDEGSFDMQVALDNFREQHIEAARVREERDTYQEQLDRSEAGLLRMTDLYNNAVEVRTAIEHRFEPIGKENKELKKNIEQLKTDLLYFRGEKIRLIKILESRDTEIEKQKGKVSEVEAKLKSQKTIGQEALRTQEKKLKVEKESVEDKLREANKTIKQEKSLIDRLSSDKRGLEKHVLELQEELKHCNKDIDDLETTKQGQKTTIDYLEKELGREITAGKERSQDIRKAQESAFRMKMVPAKWLPKADTDVRRSLDKLADDLWSWTKTCVRKDISMELFDSDVTHRLLSRISHKERDRYRFSFEDPRHAAKLPTLICIASITSMLYAQIFSNPFFWQRSTASGKDDGGGSETYQVYREAIQDDEKGANEWRCQMLRTFDPHIYADDSTDSISAPEECRKAAAQRFIDSFLNSDANNLLDLAAISDESRLKQLFGIITRATRISYHLWTQKSRLAVLGLDGLVSKAEGGVIRYEHGSDLMQHHAYHNIELSRDDRCLDGKEVALVTHPVVVAYGDSNGEHYREYKVWKKAEVWMA